MTTVDFEEDGDVAIIALNRPEKANALNRAMATDLNAAFARFFAAEHLRVAVYCARGRAFSGGADVVDVQAAIKEENGDSATAARAFDIAFEDAEFNEKPIIAAIQGNCYGFGFTTSLACDMRIAAEGAQFCLPEVKVGIASVHGNMRLVQLAGLARSMELLLTGEKRDARWAHSAGIVNEVVPAGQLMRCALEYAHAISGFDQSVVYNTRKVGNMSQFSSFDDTVAKGLALRKNFKINTEYADQVVSRKAARVEG